MRQFDNKVALVTGGSTGIGREVSLAFAREGIKVAVNYIGSRELADAVVAQIESEGGLAMAVCADVSKEDQVNAMVQQVNDRWGGIDILVNNAGIYPRKPWFELTVEDWDHVMGVNLRSCFLTSKAVYPHMKAQHYGKIINVSSVTFLLGQAGFAHYVASKGGVIGFTRALSREVGEFGITVNAITPGAVMTEQELADIPDLQDREELRIQMSKVQAIPRRQLPADMVGTFLYLASPDSDFVTGQTINVDGGWAMH